jgi:hypothetical protein
MNKAILHSISFLISPSYLGFGAFVKTDKIDQAINLGIETANKKLKATPYRASSSMVD